MPAVHTVDGVPVYWTEQPGRFGVSLVFRVGVRDESFSTAGITHLVEHLAFATIPVLDHEANGEVGLSLTEFTFEGTIAEVSQSLSAICASLSDLSAGRIDPEVFEREKAILEAEGETSAVPPEVGEALSNHYGLDGPGLASASESYLDQLDIDEVAQHAGSYFTRANAVLVCSSAPPEGLRLPLPPGTRQGLKPASPVNAAGPAEYASGGSRPVISFRVPGSSDVSAAAMPLLDFTLDRRVHDLLRRRDGLVYGCEVSTANVDGNGSLAIIVLDVAPRNAVEALRRTLAELRSLRDTGPTQDEIRRTVARLSADAHEPGSDQVDAYEAAVCHLLGQRAWSFADYLDTLASESAMLTRGYLADLDSTLLVGLPEESIPDEADPSVGTIYPARESLPAQPIEGAVYKRGLIARFAGAPADARLVVGEAGCSLTLFGQTTSVRWEDVVGLERETLEEGVDAICLFTRNAFQLSFPSAWFRRGQEAVDAILQAVPRRLQYVTKPENDKTAQTVGAS